MVGSLLHSSLLPVPHGFSTRRGGVSEGPFASLNASVAVGDLAGRVEENLRRIATQAEVRSEDLSTANQVHGRAVVRVDARASVTDASCEADGLFTEQLGLGVGVKTADCVPVLLVDPDGRRVCAVHSGWRGTQLEIAAAAAQVLIALGARPERLLAAIGPSIRLCCYEVSEELAQKFIAHFGGEVVARDDGLPHLDLARAIGLSLKRLGLRPGHIDVLPHCTACEPEDFFSHRRDKGVTGRHLNFAVCRF